MRIFLAGLRKLVKRPASLVSVGLLVGLLGLILIASATIPEGADGPGSGGGGPGGGGGNARALITFPGTYDLILSFLLGLGGLVAVIYGAAIAGSEWGWGTLKNAVARGESRVLYMLGTFASIAVMLAVGLAIAFALGVLLGVLAASIAGISTAGISDAETLGRLPAMAARGWFSIVEQAALGFAIATLARSQLAGIGAGIAFYFGEGFARFFFPDVIQYLPLAVASASVTSEGGVGGPGGGGDFVQSLPADTALVLVAVWLAGSLVVAALFTERAEITG